MKWVHFLLPILFICVGSKVKSQSSRSDTIGLLCQIWKIKSLDKEPIDEDLREEWKYMIKHKRTEFRSNMTFIESDGEDTETGKWTLDKTGKEITFIFKDGVTLKWIILSLSSAEIHFREKYSGTEEDVSGILIPVKK